MPEIEDLEMNIHNHIYSFNHRYNIIFVYYVLYSNWS